MCWAFISASMQLWYTLHRLWVQVSHTSLNESKMVALLTLLQYDHTIYRNSYRELSS